MKQLICTFIFMLLVGSSHAAGYMPQLPYHRLHVTLQPEQHSLKVTDQIIVPRGSPRTIKFTLHNGLNPVSIDAEIKLVGKARNSWMSQYSVKLREGRNTFTLEYGGEIFHPLVQEIREARTFESSIGVIAEEGVVLDGNTGWYPRLELEQSKGLLNYSLEIEQPKNWRSISQGTHSLAGDNGEEIWQERQPQQGIHLIAGLFRQYTLNQNGVQAMVYLRYADAWMAKRYLEATVRYIGLYTKLIGPYPYAKFALVENFWETGYGMPSFTLMGSQVIRLPFILDTSYPHEILHNWWGNSVYVDYEKGNWSEGLTAYLADHLLQEQKGGGAEYRRATLQKYADFVSTRRDFPLAQFTSRYSASSEAIGYGKAMMLFHMLRRQMEEDRYVLALQKLFSIYKFQQVGYSDIEGLFSQAAGKKFKPFFEQWLHRTGAPRLRLVSAIQEDDGDGYELIVNLEQVQSEPAFLLEVPIVVTMEGVNEAYATTISMTEKNAVAHIPLKAKPLRVDIDPEFDLFRRLDGEEMPPAFSQVMGAEKLLMVLPSQAPIALREQYLNLAQAWQQQPWGEMQIKWDDELEQLPLDSAAWVFGWENKFSGAVQSSLDPKSFKLTESEVILDGRILSRDDDALALSTQIDNTPVAWLAAPEARMLPVLAEKMPHYSKYSYAAFGSEEVRDPTLPKHRWLDGLPRRTLRSGTVLELVNLTKGVWSVNKSPLTMAVIQLNGKIKNVRRGNLAERSALAR